MVSSWFSNSPSAGDNHFRGRSFRRERSRGSNFDNGKKLRRNETSNRERSEARDDASGRYNGGEAATQKRRDARAYENHQSSGRQSSKATDCGRASHQHASRSWTQYLRRRQPKKDGKQDGIKQTKTHQQASETMEVYTYSSSRSRSERSTSLPPAEDKTPSHGTTSKRFRNPFLVRTRSSKSVTRALEAETEAPVEAINQVQFAEPRPTHNQEIEKAHAQALERTREILTANAQEDLENVAEGVPCLREQPVRKVAEDAAPSLPPQAVRKAEEDAPCLPEQPVQEANDLAYEKKLRSIRKKIAIQTARAKQKRDWIPAQIEFARSLSESPIQEQSYISTSAVYQEEGREYDSIDGVYQKEDREFNEIVSGLADDRSVTDDEFEDAIARWIDSEEDVTTEENYTCSERTVSSPLDFLPRLEDVSFYIFAVSDALAGAILTTCEGCEPSEQVTGARRAVVKSGHIPAVEEPPSDRFPPFPLGPQPA